METSECNTQYENGTNPKLLLPVKIENIESPATVETSESSTQYEKVQRNSSTQTATHLSANSSQKRKLKNDILECRKRLKTTAASETGINMFHKLCDKFLTKNLSKVVKEQAKLKFHSSGNRYTTDYKVFCLNLFYTSPQAYNLLSECLLNMPSKTTLKRMYMPINTKVNYHIMEALKTKANSMTDMERNCSLVINSMSLKANLYYNIKEDKIYGFHEIDGIQSPEPATYALVAMIHGIFINYKQPVGFALLSKCKNSEDLSKWIDKLIKKLLEIGFKVRVLVSDMGSDFTSNAKERQVSIETPYFFVDSNKIFYIFNATHLIKLVRNNLINYNFQFDNNEAKWDHIIQFYEKDKTQQVRSAPKLTESHIKPNKFEKIKVKLAVQVLSATVAAGLSTCRDVGAIDSTAEGTIKLIRIMNNVFDFLNSSIRFGSTEYQHAFSGTVLQISFLKEMMNFFASLKLISPKTGKDATPRVKFLEGFQITLKSILLLFEDLKSEGYSYIMTRRLNQDCLENLFGRVRTRNGNSTEPTSWQLVSAFRKIFFITIIKHSKQGNCSDDLSDILLEGNNLYPSLASDEQQSTSSEQLTKVPEVSQQGEINSNTPIAPADYNAFDFPEKNALVYTCGYLLKKCFDQHKDCSVFKSYLSEASTLNTQDTTFIRYKDCCKDGGSTLLIVPQDNFVKFVEAMENKFASYFKNKYINCKVLKNIFEEVQDISFSMPCTCFPIIYLKKLYLRMRLYYTLKYNNRAFKQCRNRRKYFSVSNL